MDSRSDILAQSLDVSLADLIDVNMFAEVCNSYYKLFDMPLRVFDSQGKLVSESAHSLPVCKLLNKSSALSKSCTKTRIEAKGMPIEQGALAHVDCVCALRYTAVPLVFQGTDVGRILLGPYLPSEVEHLPRELMAIDPAADKAEIKTRLNALSRVSDAAIRRIAEALTAVIDVILFSAHRAHVTNQLHIETVRESYRELTEKNRQLAAMNEKMQEFERLKSNFLSTVSHELRTPLTSIIGYSDMLAEGFAGELGEEQQKFIQTIKAKGDELLKLISSILDFSQVETGHLELRLTEIDPGVLLGEVVERSQEMARRRGTKLILDLPRQFIPISLDPEKLGTALGHLIENAIKFSPPGGVVRVSADVKPAENEGNAEEEGFGFVLMNAPDMLEISVEDWGIGIAESDQDRIFAPFEQIDNSSTREQGGAGLGLAVVKHFVEAHGGRVKIRSRLGEGSRFSLLIPVVDRDEGPSF